MEALAPPGWYGKLPSLGDFASRRLPPEFIEPWDEWLAAGLADWREREPQAWLDRYLAGPSWRFLLMPGAQAAIDGLWCGVLMPSVDRVGRYFPLTLAQPLAQLPADAAQGAALLAWLQRLDDLAVDAMQDDWVLEQLETELERLGPAPSGSGEASPSMSELRSALASPALLELQPDSGALALLANAARADLLQLLQGKALWLCSDEQGRPVLRISQGLPQAEQFSALMTRAGADEDTIATPLT